MMKNLEKLSKHNRNDLLAFMKRIQLSDLDGMDIKKLQGEEGAYRVRKGDFRIIFFKKNGGENIIIAVERRNDTTYNNL